LHRTQQGHDDARGAEGERPFGAVASAPMSSSRRDSAAAARSEAFADERAIAIARRADAADAVDMVRSPGVSGGGSDDADGRITREESVSEGMRFFGETRRGETRMTTAMTSGCDGTPTAYIINVACILSRGCRRRARERAPRNVPENVSRRAPEWRPRDENREICRSSRASSSRVPSSA